LFESYYGSFLNSSTKSLPGFARVGLFCKPSKIYNMKFIELDKAKWINFIDPVFIRRADGSEGVAILESIGKDGYIFRSAGGLHPDLDKIVNPIAEKYSGAGVTFTSEEILKDVTALTSAYDIRAINDVSHVSKIQRAKQSKAEDDIEDIF
jgi:hypothetical protein